MDKLIDLILLVIFAFGSAVIFTLAIIWKFFQAIGGIVYSRFTSSN